MTVPFTAYDKVPHTQFDLYQQYALMEQGTAEAARVAEDILGAREKDDLVDTLYGLLVEMKENSRAVGWIGQETYLVPTEYSLFAVLAPEGVLFHVYLLDEDRIFCRAALNVEESAVLSVGYRLMQEARAEHDAQYAR